MAKWEHKLPAVLEPLGDICVEVTIPAHPDYIALFIRAVRMLETNRLYQRDEALSAKTVTAVWRERTVTPLIEALATGTGICGNLDGECLAYPPFAGFISYSPQNPFTEPDLIPEGFEQPPFFVNGKDNAHDLPNYNKGDVILDFGSVNLEPSWDLAKTPRIELCLEGSGVAEIHLLKIVQGGVAVVSLDNPVDLGDIIAGLIGDGIDVYDLNQDIVSLPPETAEETILEIDVPTDGEHIIYIYFLPIIDDSLIPLRFGGGLREISLCGNLRPCGMPPPPPPPPLEGVTELKTEFRFTTECGMEYRYRDQDDNIIGDWIPVAGWVENAAVCFGSGEMATKQDIKEALIEWTQDTALKIGLGQIMPFSVDEDGEVVVGSGGSDDAGLPDDDPVTDIDETEASRYGAMVEIATKLELVLDKIDNYYGLDVTPDNTEQDAQDGMALYFQSDEALMQAAVTSYYSWRTVPNNKINFDSSGTFPQYLYCNGYSLNALARYLNDVATYAVSKQKIVMYLWSALLPEFFSHYFELGVTKPDNHYLDAACVPIAEQTLTNLVFAAARTTTPMKAKHRLLITVKGYALDADGDTQDWFWYRTAAGVNTRANPTFVHSSSNNLPSDNQVVWNSAHEYQYTIDLGDLNAIMTITMNKHANMNATGLTYPVPFDIHIEDLGLAVSQ